MIAEVIADELKYATHLDTNSYAQTVSIAKGFARKLASTNPNFNRERFLRACGVSQ